ncbi:membrane protein implicated in regulation of membrane protease activity [Amycolatopsis bartoniae]|uniref:Membrane protein n=1 Tax=Amycolatopsis bartoniae TaxID=941986 RepID=A0A8H9IQM3_9PSEU|nr:NfeD family protein [Amycolatopsis bartoniae]MBB2938265.1 membrane protein implicated in regulation of membrane protease activity [Amycolatopsis bartoniae]TVT09039.1 NfeD family protein [Amycolatopsis bartoniae]GHF33893.1 membrane protein [Amycolatopsis bartoniae]
MTPALIWLVAGIVLMVAEVVSGDFVLLMLGGGALLGAASAAVTGNPVIDVIVFAVASTALLWLARPALKRRFLNTPDIKMGPEALIGTHGVVVAAVDGHHGQVRLGGDVWSARSLAEGELIEPGTKVTVVQITGATAVVSPEI